MFHVHWRHATAEFFNNIALFQGAYLIKILVDMSDAPVSGLRAFFDNDRDLSSLRPTLKEVLANRVMNKDCFGKIVIFSEGI